MKTIGIIGGSGFTGKYITELLVKNGYSVIIFTRSTKGIPNTTQVMYAQWDWVTGTGDVEALKRLDVAIHLAGAGIAEKRWTTQRKKEILDSRVNSTNFLLEQLKLHAPDCKTFIAASATGFYGPDNPGNSAFTEDASPATDFLGNTCRDWENASKRGATFMRTAVLRFGIVLGKEGGAFPELAGPMKFGIMPILGNGKQVVSWISVEDIAGIVLFAIEHEGVSGIYNTVAPNPATHKQLMQTISRLRKGFAIPAPVPAFVLKIMLGELSIELLKSCNVSAKKIQDAGYKFAHPEISGAIGSILAK